VAIFSIPFSGPVAQHMWLPGHHDFRDSTFYRAFAVFSGFVKLKLFSVARLIIL
jgi:hypothetical protein